MKLRFLFCKIFVVKNQKMKRDASCDGIEKGHNGFVLLCV